MHRIARSGALVATGLLAALALTGCGGDGSKDDADKGSPTTAAPAPDGGGDSASEEPSTTGDLKALEGAWAGQTDGKAVVLSVAAGKAVVVADAHVCTGTAKDMGKPMLELTCADGDTARTMGTIESNDGKTVVVSWDAGTKDTLAKTDAGALKGLPDLPDLSDVTDLPTP